MSSNPFNRTLDWTFQGTLCRVKSGDEQVYEGWVDKIHHSRGSVVLHDEKEIFEDKSAKDVGSVFVRTTTSITQLDGHKEIKIINPELVGEAPFYPGDPEPADTHMRQAYRNGFTGSFPVVRRLPADHERVEKNRRYEVVNGHKRVRAMKRVGLFQHPFEVIRCTDEEQRELIKLAHRSLFENQEESDGQAEEITYDG